MSTIKNSKQIIIKRIIASALHSFSQQGIPNVTLNHIGLKVGISTKEMPLYFKSKTLLIETIVQQHLEQIQEQLTQKKQDETFYKLLSLLDEKTILNEEESTFLPIYSEAFLPYINSVKLKHEYQNFFNELNEYYLENIEERILIGELNEEINTRMLSNMLVSMLDGAVLHKGFFRNNKQSQELLLKQKLALLHYQMLHWYFKVRYHAKEETRSQYAFLSFIYKKLKYKVFNFTDYNTLWKRKTSN